MICLPGLRQAAAQSRLVLWRHHGLRRHALIGRGGGPPQSLRLLARVRVLAVLPAPPPDLLQPDMFNKSMTTHISSLTCEG